jgi:hypothetical protein
MIQRVTHEVKKGKSCYEIKKMNISLITELCTFYPQVSCTFYIDRVHVDNSFSLHINLHLKAQV